jgi:branched-chain amino acid aminotransferase
MYLLIITLSKVVYYNFSMATIPFAIHKYAFFRKDFVDFADAKISVMTHAFLYGTAVFEGIRAYYNKDSNKIYALFVREHIERLVQSCKIMRINPCFTVDEMCERVLELIKKNAPKTDAYIRPSWFKDALRIGPSLIGGENEDSFVITSLDLGDYLDTSKGISVQVSSWRRLSDNAIPARAKVNGSYVNTGLAKSQAQLAGYDDAIFLTEEGHVAEGSAMNLFLVKNNKLVTSPVTDNILEGITRKFVIDLAINELGLAVETRNIDRTELYVSDEAFFCGTGAQVAAIGSIDNYVLSDGNAGPVTKKLQELYTNICRGNVSKYHHILSEVSY